MSLQSIGLYWAEEKGWTISCDEGSPYVRGLVKSIKIMLGPQDLEKRKLIEPLPLEDALGSALLKTERSVIMVKSKSSTFLINSASFIKMFVHAGGRTAHVGDVEFLINGCEINMISMVIEETDFDSSDAETTISSTKSVRFEDKFHQRKMKVKSDRKNTKMDKYNKILKYIVLT
jgi:hypothetical protein